jgi:putative signal transducing protein
LPRTEWRVLESVASPAMGSIYKQVLQQAGIPTLTRQDGAGAGAMGGAPTGVSLLVPAKRLAEARELLDAGVATSEVEHE